MHVQCMQIYENVDDVARANRANNKRYCKTLIYLKHHPNENFKNIMEFSALANSEHFPVAE